MRKSIVFVALIVIIAAAACGVHTQDAAQTSALTSTNTTLPKAASVIPPAQRLVVRDAGIALSGGGYTLSWKYENPGDYNQDGVVGLEDIAPLTEHFNEEASPTNEWIDGSGDGVIGVADITPIAMNWGSEVAGYRIEGAQTTEGPWSEVASLTTDEGDTANGRLAFTSENTPGFIYYRIVTLTPDGDAAYSSILIAPSNEPVIYGVSPTSGYQHEEYTFTATVSGQEPLTYAWDFGGGASPNASSDISPTVALSDAGEYACTLTISNSYGPTTFPFTLTVNARDTWAHTWGGGKDDGATGIALDSRGNVYLAGFTLSFGAGNLDILLLKYNATGELVFAKTWGSVGIDATTDNGKVSIAVDALDNVYVASISDSFGQEENIYDALLLKFDADGNLQWARTWGGDWIERVCGVGIDAEGNVYVSGSRAAVPYASWDVYILKYSPDGELLHAVNWDSGQMDFVRDFSVGGNGNCYAVIHVNTESGTNRNALIVSFDKNGAFRWARLWETEWDIPIEYEFDELYGVAAGDDGLVRCVGTINKTGYSCPLLMTFDESGELGQSKLIDLSIRAAGNAVDINHQGVIYMTGYVTGEQGGALLLALNSAGSLAYSGSWSPGGVRALAFDASDNLYLAGEATDNASSWISLQATPSDTQVIISPLEGITSIPTGIEGTPSGIITSPEGILDSGGGGGPIGIDCLVLKNYPH